MSATGTEATMRERSLAHYLNLLRRRWLLVIAPAVVAVLVGGWMASQQTDVFVSSATVRVGDPSLPSGIFDARNAADIDQLLATSIEIIDSAPVEDQVLAAVSDDASRAFQTVDVSRVSDTVLVEIEVRATEAAAATVIAQTWAETHVANELARTVGALTERATELRDKANELDAQLQQLNLDIAAEAAALADSGPNASTATLSGLTRQRDDLLSEQAQFRQQAGEFEVEAALRESVVEVVFPANIPGGPVGAKPIRTAGLAGVLGIMLGVGLAVVRDEFDDRVHTDDQLEAIVPGVPILAAVPGSLSARRSAPPRLLSGDDPRAESFRALRTNFEFMCSTRSRRERGRIVMITSPSNGEGKSTTAANLSAALVSLGRSVVLVDADLRRGNLHHHFNGSARPGLVQVLVDDEDLDVALQPLGMPSGDNLFLLAGGGRHPSPAELLSTDRFGRVIADLANIADYVIVDAPPTLPVTDALVLGRAADDVVIVVGAGRTHEPQLRTTMDAIRQLDLPVLGFVLNGVSRSATAYGEYSDYVDDEEPGRGRRVVPRRPAPTNGAPVESDDRHVRRPTEPVPPAPEPPGPPAASSRDRDWTV